MRKLILKLIIASTLLPALALAQQSGGGGGGGGGTTLPNPTGSAQCFVSTAAGAGNWTWGSCSGASTLAFASITTGTNATTLTMGSSGVLTYSGSGLINANELLGNALPSLATGNLQWNGSAWVFATVTNGTVTSAAIAGTANEITATGTCTITTTGTCTLSLPSSVILPGTLSLPSQLTSTVSTGTAPFVVSSTTAVANLNASLLLGNTWASPGTIGGTTPGAGTFSALTDNALSTSTEPVCISSGTLTQTGCLPAVPTGTVGQVVTYNSSNAPVATSKVIDNTQSGGSGVTLAGPVTFSGSAFQWYGTATPSGALSCGSNAEGFGSDTSNNPSWCNAALGTNPIYWLGTMGPGSVGTAMFGTGGGSANAQTWTHINTPAVTSYTNGMIVSWIPSANNTTAPVTLQLDSASPVVILKQGGVGLAGGDILQNYMAVAIYDASLTPNWLLLNPQTVAAAGVTSIATTSPIGGGTITTTGTISCATCVTSAASLTNNAVVIGQGGQASATISADTNTTHVLFATAGAPAFAAITSAALPLSAMGTIAGGTWNGTAIGSTYGGTGINSSSSTGVAQVSSGTWSISTALANGTTATTQSLADNTTKVATDAFVVANSVSNPCSLLGGVLYENGSSTLSCLNPPTTPNSVPQTLTSTPSGGVGQAWQWGLPGVTVDAQSASSYTVSVTDRVSLLQTTNSTTSTAVAIPQAGSSGFGSGFTLAQINTGTVIATDTPTISTINGNTTAKLVGAVSGHNPEAMFVWSDNTNYWGAEILPTDANGRLGCEGLMALTGDVTNSAGTCATTVGQVNGAAVPASALIIGTNSSSQFTSTGLLSGKIFVGNGSNNPASATPSGDVSMTNAGVFTVTQIEAGAIPVSAFFVGTNASKQLVADQPFVPNAQTGTYQVVAGDFSAGKTIPVASGTFTITLVASGSQPAAGQWIWIENYGSGTVTIARSGQNINGAASNLTLGAGSASAPTGAFVYSDGTNYEAQVFGAGSGGGVSSITGDGTIISNSGSTGAVTLTLANAGAGTVLGNSSTSAAAPSYTSTPVLGKSGTVGTVGFGNATSGVVTLGTVTGALGTVTASLPANTGTIAELNLAQSWTAAQTIANTSLILTGLASATVLGTNSSSEPIAAALTTGQVWNGVSNLPSGTTTPTLGASGTVGTIAFGNATSGTITLGTVTGALGSVTASLPANTGTIAELNLAQTWSALQTFGANASIAATAHGVLLSENTSAVVATAVGATNQVLNGNTGADPTWGAVPIAAVGTAGLSGTAPITISGAGAIACATCVTSAASLATGGVVLGTAGTQASATNTQLVFSGSTLTVGLAGTGTGIVALGGATSGTATITGPAVAGTASNPIAISNAISLGTPPTVTTPGTGSGMFGTNGTEPASISYASSGINFDATYGCPVAWMSATNYGCVDAASNVNTLTNKTISSPVFIQTPAAAFGAPAGGGGAALPVTTALASFAGLGTLSTNALGQVIGQPIGVTTAAMATQATNAAINITGMSWSILNNKNYRLSCEIPVTLTTTATLAFSLANSGGGSPTSVSLDAEGSLGAAGAWGEINALAQTTWAGAKTGASGAVAGTTVAKVWAQIQGSSNSGGTLTLQTWDIIGTGTIQVLANATCTLLQEN